MRFYQLNNNTFFIGLNRYQIVYIRYVEMNDKKGQTIRKIVKQLCFRNLLEKIWQNSLHLHTFDRIRQHLIEQVSSLEKQVGSLLHPLHLISCYGKSVVWKKGSCVILATTTTSRKRGEETSKGNGMRVTISINKIYYNCYWHSLI